MSQMALGGSKRQRRHAYVSETHERFCAPVTPPVTPPLISECKTQRSHPRVCQAGFHGCRWGLFSAWRGSTALAPVAEPLSSSHILVPLSWKCHSSDAWCRAEREDHLIQAPPSTFCFHEGRWRVTFPTTGRRFSLGRHLEMDHARSLYWKKEYRILTV